MQYALLPPEKLSANVALPASKSISNRALIIQALTNGATQLHNLSDCDDTKALIEGLNASNEVDIHGAGTAMRFLTAYFAVTDGTHLLTGNQRMQERPIGILVEALRFLGADIRYLGKEGFPPLEIHGRKGLRGGEISIDAGVSSQFITALLLIAPTLRGGLRLKLIGDIVSKPYIELTLLVMRAFGAAAEWTDVDEICVAEKPYTACDYTIENDWSAAAYWYEIVSLMESDETSVRLHGLHDASPQGDSVLRYLFYMLGVETIVEDGDVVLKRIQRATPRLDYNFINSPDLIQSFVACCVAKGIPFHFSGCRNLRIKETDRFIALRNELAKIGATLYAETSDEISWDGKKNDVCEPVFDTYDDHRMAMSLAPLAIRYPRLRINDPQVVTKSYPAFWTELQKAGFSIEKTAE